MSILLAILGGLWSAATVIGALLKPLAPYLVLVGMGFVLCLLMFHEGCSCRRQREPRPPRPPRRRSLDSFDSFDSFNSFNLFTSFNPFSRDPQGSAYKETNR